MILFSAERQNKAVNPDTSITFSHIEQNAL